MMKPEHLKKIAEILVDDGYAISTAYSYSPKKEDVDLKVDFKLIVYVGATTDFTVYEQIDILSGTLEARRQADIIEDYLEKNKPLAWLASRADIKMLYYKTRHQWRLDRMAWCINRLCDEN